MVSARGRGRSSVRGTMKSIRLGAEEGCPFGGRCRISFRGQMQDVLPGDDVIELREIHLARQSSLQVPVGHIPVPGGIKLCSPGTFWISNYLIINNGPCQVNFTKPNSATIRYTNSERGSARMPRRHLWVGWPCQSADRSPLRHAGMSLRYLWKWSLCQRPV